MHPEERFRALPRDIVSASKLPSFRWFIRSCTQSHQLLLIVPQREIDSTIFCICSSNDAKERCYRSLITLWILTKLPRFFSARFVYFIHANSFRSYLIIYSFIYINYEIYNNLKYSILFIFYKCNKRYVLDILILKYRIIYRRSQIYDTY